MKLEMALIAVVPKSQVASSAPLSVLHKVSATAEEACKYCEKLKDVKERLRVEKIAANKTRYDAKTAKEKMLKLKGENGTKEEHGQNKIGELTKQLRKHAVSDTVRSKKLVAVHAELKPHKKTGFLR